MSQMLHDNKKFRVAPFSHASILSYTISIGILSILIPTCLPLVLHIIYAIPNTPFT